MKFTCLILLVAVFSCTTDNSGLENQQSDFEKMARNYQYAYMQGSKNCEEIIAKINEGINMWENGKTWTYSDLENFCPHLPEKNVIRTYNNQKLLNSTQGYDFVSQLYVTSAGDTFRETTSRIWKKTDDTWKIVHMNNLIMKE